MGLFFIWRSAYKRNEVEESDSDSRRDKVEENALATFGLLTTIFNYEARSSRNENISTVSFADLFHIYTLLFNGDLGLCNRPGSLLFLGNELEKNVVIISTDETKLKQDASRAQSSIFNLVITNFLLKEEKKMNENQRKVTAGVKDAFAKEVISHILAITFTDAAANEMRTRIAGGLLDKGFHVDPKSIPAMTFNALYMNIIREFAEEVSLKAEGLSVIDANPTAIASKLEPLVTGENRISDLNYGIEVSSEWGVIPIVMKFFSLVKESGIDITKDGGEDAIFALEEKHPISKDLTRVAMRELLDKYQEYQQILKDENMITFADQEILALEILKNHPGYLGTLGIKHLIVDEFQDSNDANMELVRYFQKELIENGGSLESIFVIGDDDQSIYGFRKANPENMTKFEEKIGCKVNQLSLSNNYRSYAEILDPSFDFVDQNTVRIAKKVNAAKGNGGSYELQAYGTQEEELERIASEVKDALFAGKTVAVEARTKNILRKISVVLAKKDIPWVIKAPIKVLENAKVKGVIGLCDGFFEPEADMGYIQYLVAKYTDVGYKEKDADEIEKEKDELKREFSNFILLPSGFQMLKFKELIDALGDADEIFNKWKKDLYQCEDLPEMIKFITDYRRYGGTAEMKMENNYDGYCDLITCHSAKGLEWDHIILTLDDFWKSPLAKENKDTKLAVEEERRLIFVAMTRAKERLFVTGKYVSWTSERDGEVFNAFLRELYSLRDKKADEKNGTTLFYQIRGKNCSTTFDDEVLAYRKKKAETEEARRQEAYRKAREKRAKNKKDALKKKGKLSKAEADWYDQVTANATQLSFDDLFS